MKDSREREEEAKEGTMRHGGGGGALNREVAEHESHDAAYYAALSDAGV
jgi:hypothetical protein